MLSVGFLPIIRVLCTGQERGIDRTVADCNFCHKIQEEERNEEPVVVLGGKNLSSHEIMLSFVPRRLVYNQKAALILRG